MKRFTLFVIDIFEAIYTLLGVLFDSLANGLQFIVKCFSDIPEFLFGIFKGLPNFFEVGYTGLLGAILLIVIFKFFAIVKGSG